MFSNIGTSTVTKFEANKSSPELMKYPCNNYESQNYTAKFKVTSEAGTPKEDSQSIDEPDLVQSKSPTPQEHVEVLKENVKPGLPEVSMALIEPACALSPQKEKHINQDYDSISSKRSTGQKKRRLEKENKVNRSNDTPKFHKFSKDALGIEKQQESKFMENIHGALDGNQDSSESKKVKLVSSKNQETISACKALLKKSKVELVGMLFASK